MQCIVYTYTVASYVRYKKLSQVMSGPVLFNPVWFCLILYSLACAYIRICVHFVYFLHLYMQLETEKKRCHLGCNLVEGTAKEEEGLYNDPRRPRPLENHEGDTKCISAHWTGDMWGLEKKWSGQTFVRATSPNIHIQLWKYQNKIFQVLYMNSRVMYVWSFSYVAA